MNYNTQHQNFIIISKLSLVDYLSAENLWAELINILTPLIEPIKGVHNIGAEQAIKGKGTIKLGRLSWKKESLRKLVGNYLTCGEKDQFIFSYFSGYFPNLTTCVKTNVTPNVTLMINDTYSDNTQYQSGFFISFREDYYDELGESKVLSIIEEVSLLLKGVLKLRAKRSYAKPYLGAWTDSLQDLFPTTAVKVEGNELVLNKGFESWQGF